MLGSERVFDDLGYLCGNIVEVKKRTFRLRHWIDDIPDFAVAGLIFIPETTALPEPVRIDRCGEKHRVQLLLRETFGLDVSG